LLATALGNLRAASEEAESTPVTERCAFPFMKDPKLRSILERDYGEIQRAHVTKRWKSVIILCGSAIETILTAVLHHNDKQARAAKKEEKAATRLALRDACRHRLVAGRLHCDGEGQWPHITTLLAQRTRRGGT
jgi:hypothetical protein